MRALRTAVAVVAAAAVLTGCGDLSDLEAFGDSGSSSSSGGSSKSKEWGTNPLDNPDGTKPGLAPITSAKDKEDARAIIEKVRTRGRGPKTGYDRDEFGYAWADNADGIPMARNGCDTRNDILARDGRNPKYRSGSDCVLESLTIYDPYTETVIEWRKSQAAKVQIDHVMPLSYNWQMGASRWSKAKRVQIANDPLNLLAVDGSTNSSKGDSSPATWLPPSRKIRCAYVVRFAQVALKYDLPVTPADKTAMLEQCR